MSIKEKILLIIEKLFPYFLLCQVLIDIITTIFVHKLNFMISFGMIIRFLFIFIATIYIMLKNKKLNKVLLILLILINIYQIIYLYIKIPSLDLFSNVRYYLRSSYYAIMLLFLNSYKDKVETVKLLNIINVNVFFIITVYILSILTNSGLPMYDSDMYGTSAWFSSGNEISSIMTILSFISLYCFLKKSSFMNFLILIGSVFVLIMIGTKNSLIALILLLILSLITLTYISFKNKKNIKFLIIFLPCLIITCVFYKDLPAYKNIINVSTTQKLDNIKSTYTDYTEIPVEVEESRKKYQYNDINSFAASINLNITINEIDQTVLQVNGYFYPEYFDLSHPKYIEKYLIIYNDTETYKYKLTDIYNKYVKETVGNEYNSDFSGIYGNYILDDNIDSTKEYNIEILIYIDGIEKKYNIIDSVVTNQSTIKKLNNKIIMDPNLAEPTKVCQPLEINIPLLSGRMERVSEFVSCNPNYKTYQLLMGSGYIKNYTDSNGFEMDIIEIFITYGIVGFFAYFGMTFILLFNILISMVKNPQVVFKNFNYLLVLALLIGFGLAAFVGHTILTPGPAIYLAVLLIITSKILKENSI